MDEKPTYQELEKRIQELEQAESERKHAEYELQKRETTIQSVFDATPVGICIMKNRVYQRVNRDWRESFGYSEENLIGRTTEFLYESHEECERVGNELYKNLLKKGISFARTRLKRSDGEFRDVNLIAKPLDPYDIEAGTVVVVHDITDRKRAEAELKQSEEQFRTVAEKSPNMIFINKKGKIVYVNTKCEELMGYKRSEFYSPDFSFFTLIAPDSIETVELNFRKHMSGEQVDPYEYAIVNKEGKRIEAIIATKLIDYEGEKAILGIVTDISERKRMEKAIRESEDRFKALTESTSDWIWEVSHDGIYTYVSPKVKDLLGYEPEEVIGKTPFDFMPPDEAERAAEYFKRKVEFKSSFKGFENTNIHKNGRHVTLETGGVPVFDEDGNIRGFRGIDRDITERKQAEKELRESEEKYRMLAETASESIITCDLTGRIYYINRAGIELSGYPKDEALGKNLSEILPADQIPMLTERIKKRIAGDKETRFLESALINKAGKRVQVELSSSPIVENDKVVGTLIVARDITERKTLEVQLQQIQKMESIAILAGGIAHQFNNALSLITGNLDLLTMDYPNDESINNYVEQMRYSTHRITQLTSQLLAYARGGKYQVKIVALSDFVRDTLPLIGHTIKPSVYTETDLSRNILNVKADLTQMQMVLSAILSNASEAIEGEGRIRITCKNKMIQDERAKDFPGLKPGPYVNLEIEDDGKGMDEETKSRIFEPFFTTKFQGRGLGLAAAYGIIKNHDGWISVDSELGKGTTVRIFLPAIEAKVKELKKQKIEPVKGTGTILVIEDEEMLMDVSRAILERLGYRVLAAQNGKEAIDIAKTFDGDIDLAILDILLPDMGGKAIYPLLMEARPKLKVIICSGYSIDGSAKEILDAGAQDFIQKPFTIADLSEKLKKVLEGE